MMDIVRLSRIFERLPDTPEVPCLVSFNGRRFDIAKIDRIFRAVVFDDDSDIDDEAEASPRWATVGGHKVNMSYLGRVHKTAAEYSKATSGQLWEHAWIHRDGAIADAGEGHDESAGSMMLEPEHVLKSGIIRVSRFTAGGRGGRGEMSINSRGPITLPQMKALRQLHISEDMPPISHSILNKRGEEVSRNGAGVRNGDTDTYEADLRKNELHPTQQKSMFRRS